MSWLGSAWRSIGEWTEQFGGAIAGAHSTDDGPRKPRPPQTRAPAPLSPRRKSEDASAAAPARAPSQPPPVFAIGSASWPGLSKLSEEAGEVVQVIGKLMGTGGAPAHWDGTDLRARLIEEIADVYAACDFVLHECPEITYPHTEAIQKRRKEKLALFLKWHRDQTVVTPSEGV